MTPATTTNTTTSGKKNKKKASPNASSLDKDGTSNSECIAILNKAIESFTGSLAKLTTTAADFQKTVDSDQLAAVQVKFSELELSISKLPDLPEWPQSTEYSLNVGQKTIRHLMEASYYESFEHIKHVLEAKTAYFRLLKM